MERRAPDRRRKPVQEGIEGGGGRLGGEDGGQPWQSLSEAIFYVNLFKMISVRFK